MAPLFSSKKMGVVCLMAWCWKSRKSICNKKAVTGKQDSFFLYGNISSAVDPGLMEHWQLVDG
jgi:hypothetical protein